MTAAPSADPVGSFSRDVDAVVTHARGVLLAAKQPDIEASLARGDAALRALSEATVVVVGEVKRGKSSLINALVGQPSLCPVDVDVATNTYVVVRDGPPHALVRLASEPEPRPIELSDLARYATTTGNPANERGVERVEVWTPAPELQGLSIVDTPGVGGLESVHRRLVLDVLDVASCLLFVLDATAPISRPELDFLLEASQRVETIIVVVTKTDAVGEWLRVVEDDRAVLASEGPQFVRCPVVGVSSKLAFKALEFEALGYPDDASSLRRESHIDDLGDLLGALAAHGAPALLATRLRRLRVALGAAYSNLGVLMAAGESTSAIDAQINAAEDRLDALRHDSASWSQDLTTKVQLLSINTLEHLETQRVATAARVDKMITQAGASAATVDLLQTEVEALHRATMTSLAAGILDIGRKLLGEMLEETSLPAVADEMLIHEPASVVTKNHDSRWRITPIGFAETVATANQGDNIAHAILEALKLVAATAAGFAGPGALIGLGWAAGLHLLRNRQSNTAEARAWAAKTLMEAEDAIQRAVGRSIVEGQDQLATAVRGAIEARAREIKEARSALDQARIENDETRGAVAAQLRLQQGELRSAIQRVETLLAMAATRLELVPAQQP
jgi:GTPase SAR1 family protein